MFNKVGKSITSSWLTILFCVSLIFSLCFGNLHLASSVNAQTPDAAQLVNQGINSYKNGDFRAAIQPWEDAINLYQKNHDWQNVAIVNENLARVYQQLGETETTLSYWEKVLAYYRNNNNLQKVGRVQTEIAQLYSNLGQTNKAISILCGVSNIEFQEKLVCQPGTALKIAWEQKDQSGEIAALGSLGEVYRLQGNYQIAIKYLELAKSYQNNAYKFAIFNSLGNAHASLAQLQRLRAKSAQNLGITTANDFQQQALNHYDKAINYFQTSIQSANQQNNQTGELRSHLNLIKLAYNTIEEKVFNPSRVVDNIQKALDIIHQIPNSTIKVYAAIDLANIPANNAELTSPLTECLSNYKLPKTQVKELLHQAIKVAQTLPDSRSESYALGALGHFYECQGKSEYPLALSLTNQAIIVADQNLQAKDSLYLWEWQAGRILTKYKTVNEALPFYQRAYKTLEQLRSDILITNRDFQFDFRDIVEPVYRQLAQIQLELATSNQVNSETQKQKLRSALTTINSLRLAEIQNYFGNDCILANFNNNNEHQLLPDDTAVISSIVLADKTGILLTLPNQEEHLHWLKKSREDLRQEITNFRTGLLESSDIIYNTANAENLYELIIRPLEKYLDNQKINTLVFIQDGFLRDVPMSAIYDHKTQKYLIQKYAVAATSSLDLTNLKPRNFQSKRTLVLAVSRETQVDNQTFDELANVPLEVQAIKAIYPKSKKLENEEFAINNLIKQLKNESYPIIHIATHAQFGILPEDTFLVTGNNEKLTINKLETLLREAGNVANFVELLTLTACETATGDERTTLGLAGVALQAGAKSALASLWSVNDESTASLVTEFYNQLRNSGMSKAQALQAAQLKLINARQTPEVDDKYEHPYYWSAFILIGNWL